MNGNSQNLACNKEDWEMRMEEEIETFRTNITSACHLFNNTFAAAIDYCYYPTKLKCGHVFGLSCIHSWLQKNTTCPSCRAELPEPEKPVIVPAPVQHRPEIAHEEEEPSPSQPPRMDVGGLHLFASVSSRTRSSGN